MFKEFFKRLFCKHEWREHGFSYVECKICDKVKYNPNLCSELITKTLCGMVDKGIWKKEGIKSKYKRYLK